VPSINGVKLIVGVLQVDYAGSMILEIYEDDRKEPAVRFKFKNGTNDDTFETYNYMRSTNDVALSTLVEYLTVSFPKIYLYAS